MLLNYFDKIDQNNLEKQFELFLIVKLKKTRPTSDGIDKYKMRWACLFMLGKKNMNSKTVKTWPGQVFVFFSNLKISNIDSVMFYLILRVGEFD